MHLDHLKLVAQGTTVGLDLFAVRWTQPNSEGYSQMGLSSSQLIQEVSVGQEALDGEGEGQKPCVTDFSGFRSKEVGNCGSIIEGWEERDGKGPYRSKKKAWSWIPCQDIVEGLCFESRKGLKQCETQISTQ